jgi:hypothetical protein
VATFRGPFGAVYRSTPNDRQERSVVVLTVAQKVSASLGNRAFALPQNTAPIAGAGHTASYKTSHEPYDSSRKSANCEFGTSAGDDSVDVR